MWYIHIIEYYLAFKRKATLSHETTWVNFEDIMLSEIAGERVKVVQSCLTLCDPMDYTVHGVLQAIILEWVAFSFSRGSSYPRDQTQISRVAGRFFTS